MVKVHTIGNMVGQHIPQRPNVSKRCECGSLMSQAASRCIECSARHNAKAQRKEGLDDEARDRHRRTSAVIAAGFTLCEAMDMRPFVFEWDQIVQFAPGVVIRAWWKRA